jgi:hypothetical protein
MGFGPNALAFSVKSVKSSKASSRNNFEGGSPEKDTEYGIPTVRVDSQISNKREIFQGYKN